MEKIKRRFFEFKNRLFIFVQEITFSIHNLRFTIYYKAMPNRERKNIRAGIRVAVVLKQDQRTGRETIGVVKDLLTNSNFHPHGIKVRLTDGQVGRVQKILAES